MDMQAISIHSPVAGRYLDHAEKSTRLASIAANFACFDRMKNCGIQEIVIHPIGAGDFSTQEAKTESRTRAVWSLGILAERAGQMGIRLAVENLLADSPGFTMTGLLNMIEGLGDHVGICFDIGHAEQAGLDLIRELKTATSAGKLFSLHIHDVNESGRDHFVPGEGRIDWKAFISELDTCGFQGGRILEVSPPEMDVAGRLGKVAACCDSIF
jgi:sugar phosphate isomerase/epimerase